MTTTFISIPVDAELAQFYENASVEDQQKAQVLFALLLRQMTSPNRRTLSEVMDEISDNAAARGLTEDILNNLLKDE